MRRVLVFECNEVPWRIIDWWTAQRPTSAFATLGASARSFTSVAADEGHLSPWITWPTVHRGVPNTVHEIADFGQDLTRADELAPPWWVPAIEAGRRVGLFGLLHTAPLPPWAHRAAFWVPDPFAAEARTVPESLESFQAFNLAMARQSARNVSTGIDLTSARRFVVDAPRLGLRPATVARIVGQLVAERRVAERRVRRRTLQGVLGFDLFEAQVRRTEPDAAAFFTNHVAAAMHRYWAAAFPGDYDEDEFGFDADWIERWRDEIPHALAAADRMLARFLTLADETDAVLIVVSSMGQHAAQGTPVGRQLYLRDPARLLGVAGVPLVQRRPAMDPDVSLVVAPAHVDAVRNLLGSITVGGAAIEHKVADDGFVSLRFGQADGAIEPVTFDGQTVEPAALGLVVEVIEDEVASTGYHVPEGVLAVYDPLDPAPAARHGARPEVPTTALAPTLLRLLDLPRAPHHVADPLAILGAA